jgi:group I intron endonuclease
MSDKRSNINTQLNRPGIYKILNKANGKFYIGSAINLRKRRKNHFGMLQSGTHCNNLLLRAFKKYGEENFEFSVIEFVDDVTKLIEREQYWLEQTRCYNRKIGYNISPTAGSNLGWEMPREQRDAISKLKKGKPFPELNEDAKLLKSESLKAYYKRIGGSSFKNKPRTDETKQKISASKTGRRLSKQHKLRLSKIRRQFALNEGYKNPMTGRTHSSESKAKMSEAKRLSKMRREQLGLSGPGTGRTVSEETRAKLSRIRRGKKLSKEHVAKVVAKLIGRKRSQESKQKSSDGMKRWHAHNISPMKGRKHSEETKKLMSQNRKKKRNT